MNKIKLDVYEGVYLHNSGNYFTVEFGTVEGEPAIKSHGINLKDEEVCRIFKLSDQQTTFEFAMVLNEAEYLGEL
jgi:hypothetical protein